MTTPVNIAILTYPDTTAAVVLGMHDLFLSAGRDWGLVTEGKAGPQLLAPVLRPGRWRSRTVCVSFPT